MSKALEISGSGVQIPEALLACEPNLEKRQVPQFSIGYEDADREKVAELFRQLHDFQNTPINSWEN
jgi:hypothetical protein